MKVSGKSAGKYIYNPKKPKVRYYIFSIKTKKLYDY